MTRDQLHTLLSASPEGEQRYVRDLLIVLDRDPRQAWHVLEGIVAAAKDGADRDELERMAREAREALPTLQ